jgi:hypothetical protein
MGKTTVEGAFLSALAVVLLAVLGLFLLYRYRRPGRSVTWIQAAVVGAAFLAVVALITWLVPAV